MKRKFPLLLAALMLANLTACGSGETSVTDDSNTPDSDSNSSETDAVFEYQLPDYDFNQEDFHILNVLNDYWTCRNELDAEGINGEVLNDAIYNRNAQIEAAFNLNITVSNEDVYELNTVVQTAVASGEDVYDVVYIKPDESAGILSENMLINLHDVETLQLDQDWWYQYFVNDLTIQNSFISLPARHS